MTSSNAWVYPMRAEPLAKLFSTRRRGLDVLTMPRSNSRGSYDLLVRVNGADTFDTPEFGVGGKRDRSTPELRPVAVWFAAESC